MQNLSHLSRHKPEANWHKKSLKSQQANHPGPKFTWLLRALLCITVSNSAVLCFPPTAYGAVWLWSTLTGPHLSSSFIGQVSHINEDFLKIKFGPCFLERKKIIHVFWYEWYVHIAKDQFTSTDYSFCINEVFSTTLLLTVASKPTASASPGRFVQMQNLRPHSTCTEWESAF